MGLTRKDLEAWGITGEAQDKVIAGHTDVTNALRQEIKDFEAKATKLEAVEKELSELKAKKPVNPKETEEYKALQAELADFKESVNAEKVAGAKKVALSKALEALNINKDTAKLIIKGYDLNSLEMDGENFKNPEDVNKALSAEYSAFIPEINEQGAKPETPPKNTAGGITVEQFNKMTYAERENLHNTDYATYEQLRNESKGE